MHSVTVMVGISLSKCRKLLLRTRARDETAQDSDDPPFAAELRHLSLFGCLCELIFLGSMITFMVLLYQFFTERYSAPFPQRLTKCYMEVTARVVNFISFQNWLKKNFVFSFYVHPHPKI